MICNRSRSFGSFRTGSMKNVIQYFSTNLQSLDLSKPNLLPKNSNGETLDNDCNHKWAFDYFKDQLMIPTSSFPNLPPPGSSACQRSASLWAMGHNEIEAALWSLNFGKPLGSDVTWAIKFLFCTITMLKDLFGIAFGEAKPKVLSQAQKVLLGHIWMLGKKIWNIESPSGS